MNTDDVYRNVGRQESPKADQENLDPQGIVGVLISVDPRVTMAADTTLAMVCITASIDLMGVIGTSSSYYNTKNSNYNDDIKIKLYI